MNESIEKAVDKLVAVICRIRNMDNVDVIDIVNAADSSGLGSFVPRYLRQYGTSDFTYSEDVRHLLKKVIEHGGKELEIFLEKIYKNIMIYHYCRRFENKLCSKSPLYWMHEFCYDCEEFLDNGIRSMFQEALKLLGYSIDENGLVVPVQALDIEREVARIAREISNEASVIIEELIPKDLREKAREMAEVYIYIYCIENTLRIFIKNVCKDTYGEDYLSKINLPKAMREKILRRRAEAEKNKWLTVRGDEDLFYLDLEDLGKIIQNNWKEIFEKYFPDQHWIVQKIKEIQDMRNPVAHNCYIGETERNLLRGYYIQIVKQIADTLTQATESTETL